jgi:hypothetical protein
LERRRLYCDSEREIDMDTKTRGVSQLSESLRWEFTRSGGGGN